MPKAVPRELQYLDHTPPMSRKRRAAAMEQEAAAPAVEQQTMSPHEECEQIELVPLDAAQAAKVYTEIVENKARFEVCRTVQGAPPLTPPMIAHLRVWSCPVACVRSWP